MENAKNRRDFLKAVGLGVADVVFRRTVCMAVPSPDGRQSSRPNIILCMADDQGWGDTGYNGHPILRTPNLDEMARTGIRFDRFYSAAPVCSPTRGSCLTGRHPFRYGIFHANVGHMRPEELTLAEVLKTQGYTTGHFGKWHLGTLTKTLVESNRGGPRGLEHYSPPWENGFDVCLSTEAKVPTWDPMRDPDTGEPYGTHYWKEDSTRETENLEGDDSRVIMDRVIPFLRRAAEGRTPFFTVIWFHTPHRPVKAGPKYLAMYAGRPDRERHYYGCLTAMDEQVGRLRNELRDLGVAENTMLWFCADNGPEGKAGELPGSAGPFRGRKRDLFEGGIRVPGLLEWPGEIQGPLVVEAPCCTSDYFPTILEVLGLGSTRKVEPVDGVTLLPFIEGRMEERPTPIAFESDRQLALVDNRYKIYSSDGGETFQLYDLLEDPVESRDLSREKPGVLQSMKETLSSWRFSCKESLDGKDYPSSCQ